MNSLVKSALIEEKQVIRALLQPYLEELSHFPDEDPAYKDKNGTYHYPYLDAYWQENERHPYLLYGNGKISGFALVRHDGAQWEMAEFYVLPEFRRRGLGIRCATEIVKRHAGEWRIWFNKQNLAGRALWQKTAEHSSKSGVMVGKLDTSHDYLRFSV